MYLVAPLKMLVGNRKDKDENYNALFEERFNTRVKKKKKKQDIEELPPTRKNSATTENKFIRRANSLDENPNKFRFTENVIEEEIDSEDEAELQQQFDKSLLSDNRAANNGNNKNVKSTVRNPTIGMVNHNMNKSRTNKNMT